MVWLSVTIQTNENGDGVTLPIALPTTVAPTIDVHAASVKRYATEGTGMTTFNVGTNGQITIDKINSSAWYNLDISYIAN